MNVREMRELFNGMPEKLDLMDVFFEKTNDDFQYSLVQNVSVKEIAFRESDDSPVLAKEDCLIISDEI